MKLIIRKNYCAPIGVIIMCQKCQFETNTCVTKIVPVTYFFLIRYWGVVEVGSRWRVEESPIKYQSFKKRLRQYDIGSLTLLSVKTLSDRNLYFLLCQS